MIFKKRAVLVDLDGTLANSLPALKNVYFAFLNGFGIQGADEEFQVLNGLTLPQVISVLKEKYHLDPSLKELQNIYAKLIEIAYENEVYPHAEGVEILDNLKGKGIILGLVTAANVSLAHAFFKRHQLETLFDGLITAEAGEPGKPDPALYLRALKSFRLAPEEAIVIEDSRNGVQAALAAGIETVWIFHKELNQDNRLFYAKDWGSVKLLLEQQF
jgi:HAD superfamily hydrolase (TIGR01509 family)